VNIPWDELWFLLKNLHRHDIREGWYHRLRYAWQKVWPGWWPPVGLILRDREYRAIELGWWRLRIGGKLVLFVLPVLRPVCFALGVTDGLRLWVCGQVERRSSRCQELSARHDVWERAKLARLRAIVEAEIRRREVTSDPLSQVPAAQSQGTQDN
jgi:hypothetical protein